MNRNKMLSIAWFSTAIASSVGIIVSGSLYPLWTLLIPFFVTMGSVDNG